MAAPAAGRENRAPMAQCTARVRSARQRRRLPQRLATAALACLPTCAASDPLLGPLELARRINPDAACTRLRVEALCMCGATPCGYRISMYVPVAFVETVRAPGDSLLPLPSLASALADRPATLSSSQSGLDNTAEAHAWLLGDAAWLLAVHLPCLLCRPSDARSASPVSPAPVDPLCDPASDTAAAFAPANPSGFSPLLSALAYASELDSMNWR